MKQVKISCYLFFYYYFVTVEKLKSQASYWPKQKVIFFKDLI